jgi:hypothetical protein
MQERDLPEDYQVTRKQFKMRITSISAKGEDVVIGALADSCGAPNTVNVRYARDRGFKQVDWPAPKGFKYPGGPLDPVRGVYAIRFRATDGNGVMREHQQLFLGTDSEDCEIMLGMPALQDMGVMLIPRGYRWRYEGYSLKYDFVNADKFARTLKKARLNGSYVYAVWITPCGSTSVTAAPLSRDAPSLNPGYRQRWATLKEQFRELFQPRDNPKPVKGIVHDIPTEGDPPFRPIYNLSERELEELRQYLENALDKGWIRHSTSSAGAPILFVPKKDNSLRLCVDYRGLNRVTVKNRLALPLISEIMDRLQGARVFSKIDLKDAYHSIPIAKGDRWKTAFRTRYGHYEYNVMPFGLTNAPATFQAYIHRVLGGLVDVCCIVYLDDILIYSENEEDHFERLELVLERLRNAGLVANEKKCEFFVDEVEYLGFRIGANGIRMDPARVESIKDWPSPTSHRELQVFLGFANFYRRFIEGYAHHSRTLTDKFKGGKNGKIFGPWTWTPDDEKALRGLIDAFTTAPTLRHYDSGQRLMMTTDASAFAMSAILEQLFEGRWHPVAYWSRKFNDAESRYDTHDRELLAIVSGFRHWRHYVVGAAHATIVRTDHNNLVAWSKIDKLNMRQSRWAMELMPLDFHIQYLKGKKNPADAPSRRPDYEPDQRDLEVRAQALIPSLQKKLGFPRVSIRSAEVQQWLDREATAETMMLPEPNEYIRWSERDVRAPSSEDTVLPDDVDSDDETLVDYVHDPSPRAVPLGVARIAARKVHCVDGEDGEDRPLTTLIAELQRVDQVATKQRQRLASEPRILPEVQETIKGDWSIKGEDNIVYFKHRLYVPDDAGVKLAILQQFHDAPLAGHFGAERTQELIQRHYHWVNMKAEIEHYVASCRSCQWTHAKRHRPYGKLNPLEPAVAPWEDLSMDFITDLPTSKRGKDEYDAILVIVDRFTKMGLYIPTRKSLKAPDLADLMIDAVTTRMGLPKSIVSDRGPVFTSLFWQEFCTRLQIQRKLSTAFHPQTDGQTERMNQTLETYLRIFCNESQDNWATLLPHAEFAYNASRHSVTQMSPFYALYGFNPRASLEEYDADELRAKLGTRKVIGLQQRLHALVEVRAKLAERVRAAGEAVKRYNDRKRDHILFQAGDYVMLSTKNLSLKQSKRSLAPKFLGPIQIIEPVGANAYRLRLPSTWRIHPVVSVAHIEKWTQRDPSMLPDKVDSATLAESNLPEQVDLGEEWEVEAIIDRKRKGQELLYQVRWVGDWPVGQKETWEPLKHLRNADEHVRKYDEAYPLESNLSKKAGTSRRARKRRRVT